MEKELLENALTKFIIIFTNLISKEIVIE